MAAEPRPLPAQSEPRPAEVRLPLAVEGGTAKGARPMARAPDDPGPDIDDEEGGSDLPLFYPNRPA
jgi:hypothetical protein